MWNKKRMQKFTLSLCILFTLQGGDAWGSYALEYASPDNTRFVNPSGNEADYRGGLDLDGDGGTEIITQQILGEPGENRQFNFRAVGSSDHQEIWTWSLVVDMYHDLVFWGFYDVDADDQNEAILIITETGYETGYNEFIALDWTDNTMEWNEYFAGGFIDGILDIDGDGYPELVIAITTDPDDYYQRFEIWGSGQGVSAPEASAEFSLSRNFPNPFNPITRLTFVLDEPGHAAVRIFDSGGRAIRTLVDGHLSAGTVELVWDGRNNQGDMQASGTYFCELRMDEKKASRKMVLLK